MAGYDAVGLCENIERALKDETRPRNFISLLGETGEPSTDYHLYFQQDDRQKEWPHLIIDVVSGEPVIDVFEGDGEWQYEVFVRIEMSFSAEARKAGRPDKPDAALAEQSHLACARYMRAVQRFFATALTPQDGFALFDITTVSSGSFENTDGDNVARSSLQLALVA